MNRTLTLILAACVCFGAGTLLAGSAAATTAPQGKLTSTEYKLLSTAEAGVNKAVSATHVNWGKVIADCKSLGGGTALLATQQADCATNATLLEGFINFPGASAKCGNASPKKYICGEPLYTALGHDASSFYSAEAAARQKAVTRGLTGVCLETLAPSAKSLSEDKALATTTNKLADDMKLIVKVLKHQAPTSALSVTQVDADVKVFEHDGDVVLTRNSPSKLSACPHE